MHTTFTVFHKSESFCSVNLAEYTGSFFSIFFWLTITQIAPSAIAASLLLLPAGHAGHISDHSKSNELQFPALFIYYCLVLFIHPDSFCFNRQFNFPFQFDLPFWQFDLLTQLGYTFAFVGN
jgi:hypothetical protein